MELFRLFGTIAVNNDEANSDIDETTGKAESAQSKMSSAFKKIGAAVATYFAVDKIVGFGKEIVSVAAEVSAEASAFEQIMGDYSEQAQEKINGIADATGMVSTRLTPYMTSMTAKFKGLGYDIDDATDLASDGLNLAADAAAFWDKSLDDSMSSLNSFINGSYEGGEAIGLFANDTQMAAYAVEQGIVADTAAWSSLDEATKQATRLEYAQAMFEMSGATGQAAKESEQYANVQANLSEKWRQFKAQIGEPLLQNVVLPAMAKLSELVDAASEKVDQFKEYWPILKEKLQEIWAYVTETFSPAWEALKNLFTTVKDAVQPLIDKLTEYVSSGQAAADGTTALKDSLQFVSDTITTLLDGASSFITWLNEGSAGAEAFKAAVIALVAGFVAYKAILIATNTWHTVVSATTKIVTAAQAALNAVMNANPITIIIIAIVALVAAFIYLWNNCEGFRQFWVTIWESIKTTATTVWNAITTTITNIITGIKTTITNVFTAVKTTVTNIWNSIKSTITNVWTNITTGVSTAINSVKTTVSSVFNSIKTSVSSTWNAIKTAITTPINAAKTAVQNAIDAIKAKFNFTWSLPSLKLPHISVSGSFSLNPISWPKFSISWYKKAMDNAMLLDSPTIFGMNPAGQLLGGGEAGQEVVSGSNTLMRMIRDAVKAETGNSIEKLISILEQYFPEVIANMGNDIVMDDGVLVARIIPKIDKGLGQIDRMRGRGQ